MTERDEVAEVVIFGNVYSLRADRGRAHVEEVAALVDRKMLEVAARVSTADVGRIAILAALNLAEELLDVRGRSLGEREQLERRVSELGDRLAAVLDG